MTYPIENLCFLDFETRTTEPGFNVTDVGVRRHAPRAYPTVLAYGIGDEPIEVAYAEELREPGLHWHALPEEFRRFALRVAEGAAHFVAWNTAYDRAIWNHWYGEWCRIPVTGWLDAMAQAMASNLPGKLDAAARLLGHEGKLDAGKALINMFCAHDGAQPSERPTEWDLFLDYADLDVDALRHCWKATRPLTATEWREFHTSERINDRGLLVDLPFVQRAAELVVQDRADAGRRLRALTGGTVTAVTQVGRIASWLYDHLDDIEAREMLVKAWPDADKDDDNEGEVVPAKLSLDKERIAQLTAYFDELSREYELTDRGQRAREVITIREFGGSASALKFRAILDAAGDDARLGGQYTFNGAQQTGRYSSRGVQIHNLTRKTVGKAEYEGELIDAVAEGTADLAYLRAEDERLRSLPAGAGSASRLLSLMTRPAFVAPEGKVLVWGDWSAIEARTLPWLAGTKSADDAVLSVFRAVDADPNAADIYVREGAAIHDTTPDELWTRYRDKDPAAKDARQEGKVAVLSLGFGGGVGALQAMAGNYGIHLSDERARFIVDRWRGNNLWARVFWDHLWEAFQKAMAEPGTPFSAGRVVYVYDDAYLGGTMFCVLPCGRPLSYPRLRWEEREVENKATGEKEMRTQLTYLKGYGRVATWYGKLAENVTQAAAASLLRKTLVEVDKASVLIPPVGHTHDEVIVEPEERNLERARTALKEIMVKDRGWTGGLPLAAEVQHGFYYTKAGE